MYILRVQNHDVKLAEVATKSMETKLASKSTALCVRACIIIIIIMHAPRPIAANVLFF